MITKQQILSIESIVDVCGRYPVAERQLYHQLTCVGNTTKYQPFIRWCTDISRVKFPSVAFTIPCVQGKSPQWSMYVGRIW
jgi:hypothetical protein